MAGADGRRADAVHGAVVSDAGAVAGARGRRDRLDAVGAGAARRGSTHRPRLGRVPLLEHRRADGAAASRRSCRSPRAPTTRSSISGSDASASLARRLFVAVDLRCRWRRTWPASTAPTRAPRTASSRAFPHLDGTLASIAAFADRLQRLVRRSFRLPLAAGALVRREPPVRARRLAVGAVVKGERRLVLLRRRQGGRGLRERRADDRRGAGELARGDRRARATGCARAASPTSSRSRPTST